VKFAASRSVGLRGGLYRLSRGLIAYGIVGLVVTAIGLGALVWANDRVGHLHGEFDATIGTTGQPEIHSGVHPAHASALMVEPLRLL